MACITRSALKQWCELQEERERVDAHYHTTVFDMKAALEERIRRAEDIAAAFKHFKREVALAAEHTKTGKPIPSKQLRQLEMQGMTQSSKLHQHHCHAIITNHTVLPVL